MAGSATGGRTRLPAAASPGRLAAASAVAAAVLMLAACATPPAAPDSALRIATQAQPAFLNAGDRAGAVDARWWQRYGDPQLDALVAAALDANPDVRIALTRVVQARAGVDAASARLLPTVNAVAVRSAAETGYDAAVRQRLPDTDVRRAGADVSWEIDLFGAARAARDAAAQDALAADDARRGAQLAVIAETARQYFILRGAQQRLAIVQSLVQSQQQTLRLTELRRSAGEASEFDVDRAGAALAATRAAEPPLRTLVQVTEYRLATLAGRAPGAWSAALGVRTDAPMQQPSPIDVAAGQPADLLQRRPDLMAAEAQWRAATFRRSEAQANRFPRLVLSALFGRQWTALNALDLGATRFANVGATFALPLFAGGRIQAGIDAADAREREALAAYERSLLQALEDVESALVALRNERARGDDLEQSVAARERALQRARSLYRAGQADLLVVLDVERGLLVAQIDRATHRTDLLLANVQLFRALGGGWQAAEPAIAGTSAATHLQTAGAAAPERR